MTGGVGESTASFVDWGALEIAGNDFGPDPAAPHGAAAGFGSSWPIDRRVTAAWLGFDAPQTNSLDCVSTRWECEARLGGALSILMTHLSSVGQDLYYFSTPPRRLVALDAAFTTGSSIMPQKRNPDFVEVTRARAASVQSLLSAVTAVGRAAPGRGGGWCPAAAGAGRGSGGPGRRAPGA